MELIVHASSTGPLRTGMDSIFNSFASSERQTRAQDWLPHATVTKTLRTLGNERAQLSSLQVDEVCHALTQVFMDLPRTLRTPPTISPFAVGNNWSGMSLDCPGWIVVGQEFKALISTRMNLTCEVEFRQHISVAYGSGFDHTYHVPLASEVLNDVSLTEDEWSIGLWSRINGEWTPHIRIPW